MKKTFFKVIVYIFCVFSIVELCAEEGMEDLEKKNFFKIERLEAEIIVLKDQYKLLTDQQRLNIEKNSESEEAQDLKSVITELAAGVYSALNTKINSLNKDILLLKNQYKLLTEQEKLNIEKKSNSKEMLDLEAVAELAAGVYSTLNTKIGSLNREILILKNQYNTQEQSESEGELDLEVEFVKLSSQVKSLNEDILTASTLKEQYELSLIHI